MPATVVLGAQWGDEGKGKAIDQLAPQSTWAVRFQGGNNAGHTIVLGDTTIKLHQIPSGVTSPHCNLVLGDGMVIDPWVLEQELDRWHGLLLLFQQNHHHMPDRHYCKIVSAEEHADR